MRQSLEERIFLLLGEAQKFVDNKNYAKLEISLHTLSKYLHVMTDDQVDIYTAYNNVYSRRNTTKA